jgi:hypothetical protein
MRVVYNKVYNNSILPTNRRQNMVRTFKTKHRRYIEHLEQDPAFWEYDASVRWSDMVEQEQGPVHQDVGWTRVNKPKASKRR